MLKVSGLPSHIADEALTKLTDAPFNYLTSFSIEPVSPEKAEKIVNTNYNLVMAEKSRLMKMEQQKADFSGALLPPSLLEREEEILELRRRMREEDEKLFKTSLTIVIFADNENDLKKNTDTLITEYKKHSFTVNVFINQQEEGFNSSLPFGFSQIIERRTLTSTSSAIFIPFSTLEINDTNGINYSCNLLSKNLICYDRLSASNFNGFILGTPGSGKSFSAKIEMLNVFLRTNSDIIVIDPEDEYTALAHELDGETIRIIPGGDIHINPLEIVDEYEFDEEDTNSINAKADFILKLMECILNSPFGINSVQQTIIDECVHSLYQPFISNGRLRDIPSEKMPTLSDLQVLLGQRREPEARELSMALKLYTGKGSLNTFGFRTNVHINNRFTVYQIKDVGDRLKPIAMLTILDHVWNKIVENRKLGKNTWFYVDEIYLLFQQEYSASFLNQLFRRARKYGGIPTGITQNVSPLLESPTARDMLQNCQFIEILAQAGPDRERLKEILNLSDQLVSYITSSPRGQGLLYTGRNTIPFYSQFPKSSEVYKVLTSDMKEIKAFEEEERRNKLRKNKEEREIA